MLKYLYILPGWYKLIFSLYVMSDTMLKKDGWQNGTKGVDEKELLFRKFIHINWFSKH